jgi:hypothetical protein
MRMQRQHVQRNSMYRQHGLGVGAAGPAEAAAMQLRHQPGVSATTSTSSSTVV